MAGSLHEPRYRRLVAALVAARDTAGLTQRELAARLKRPPSYVGKVESVQRRLDIVELVDWIVALGLKPGPAVAQLLADLHRKGRGGD